MSFLKPYLGRGATGRAQSPERERDRLGHGITIQHAADMPLPAWLAEARTRMEGIVAAELERFEATVLEALAESERRYEELEREHAEAQRKLEAIRAVLSEAGVR